MEISSEECRQGLIFPSAVIRMRLHSAQKCALTGLMRPMFPCAPVTADGGVAKLYRLPGASSGSLSVTTV